MTHTLDNTSDTLPSIQLHHLLPIFISNKNFQRSTIYISRLEIALKIGSSFQIIIYQVGKWKCFRYELFFLHFLHSYSAFLFITLVRYRHSTAKEINLNYINLVNRSRIFTKLSNIVLMCNNLFFFK